MLHSLYNFTQSCFQVPWSTNYDKDKGKVTLLYMPLGGIWAEAWKKVRVCFEETYVREEVAHTWQPYRPAVKAKTCQEKP